MTTTYTLVSFGDIGTMSRTTIRSLAAAYSKARIARERFPSATVRVVEVPAGRRAVDCDISDAMLRVVA